jgi:hypothetical protein
MKMTCQHSIDELLTNYSEMKNTHQQSCKIKEKSKNSFPNLWKGKFICVRQTNFFCGGLQQERAENLPFGASLFRRCSILSLLVSILLQTALATQRARITLARACLFSAYRKLNLLFSAADLF